jgi:hypothetical protein
LQTTDCHNGIAKNAMRQICGSQDQNTGICPNFREKKQTLERTSMFICVAESFKRCLAQNAALKNLKNTTLITTSLCRFYGFAGLAI